jgi:hypothetical protein
VLFAVCHAGCGEKLIRSGLLYWRLRRREFTERTNYSLAYSSSTNTEAKAEEVQYIEERGEIMHNSNFI